MTFDNGIQEVIIFSNQMPENQTSIITKKKLVN